MTDNHLVPAEVKKLLERQVEIERRIAMIEARLGLFKRPRPRGPKEPE